MPRIKGVPYGPYLESIKKELLPDEQLEDRLEKLADAVARVSSCRVEDVLGEMTTFQCIIEVGGLSSDGPGVVDERSMRLGRVLEAKEPVSPQECLDLMRECRGPMLTRAIDRTRVQIRQKTTRQRKGKDIGLGTIESLEKQQQRLEELI